MEWVETTAKTVEEAKERALDQLGVVADDAEFEVLEEPRPGLFGRLRGEARVRARVRPAQVRPKQERRRGRRSDAPPVPNGSRSQTGGGGDRRRDGDRRPPASTAPATPPPAVPGATMNDETNHQPDRRDDGERELVANDVDVADVQRAAESFMSGLADAFGYESTVASSVDGTEIEVRVDGSSLGLLIGPGGRTLTSIQDLARVAAQRRLGDHVTRLRIDVSGYREKRQAALERFAGEVAEQVRQSGVARSLDPMPSADRKVLHDALGALDGVTSRSEGEDPNRRIVVDPG